MENLNDGATEEEIKKLEEKTGFVLPNDLKESLMIHNGEKENSPGFLMGWVILSTEEIFNTWDVWVDLYKNDEFLGISSDELDHIKPNYWFNPKWLPLTHNHIGDNHCMDFDPSEKGQFGQIIDVIHNDGDRALIADIYKEWFEKIVEKLEMENIF